MNEDVVPAQQVRALVAITPGRARNMAAIRRTGTKFEIALRSALHAAGYRFRKDYRVDADGLRVRPDIVFTRLRVAVFVDGCFWHCCPEHGRDPTSNVWYWSEKLRKNRVRDERVNQALTAAGWTVFRCWEHQPTQAVLEDFGTTLARLRSGPHAGRDSRPWPGSP